MDLNLSYTEENYLKAIYHLSQTEIEAVSTNSLAESMETTPASVSDMIKRLSQKKVISHTKYRGSRLTPEGKRLALRVVRKHRLWEVFLVEKLNFKWDEVHEIAEQLEHIKSPILVERLDEYLGRPTVDPHGDPIPDMDGNFKTGPTLPMVEMSQDDRGVIVAVKNDDPKLLQYLDRVNIRIGSKVHILQKNDFDNSMSVALDNHEPLFLSDQVSSQLMISQIV